MIVKYSAHLFRSKSPVPSVSRRAAYTNVPTLAALSWFGLTESKRDSIR